ncbi:MAG: sporulation initiation factor Spo0A C-terminal domain-containing protein, partial [Oscillospiraceae bacterium]
MDKTERLLRQLDITSDYMGYWCLTIALQIVRDQQLARARVTKDLYPVIAKELQISIDSVERDLRTVLKHSWKARQASMERLGFTACPSPGKFICAVA